MSKHTIDANFARLEIIWPAELMGPLGKEPAPSAADTAGELPSAAYTKKAKRHIRGKLFEKGRAEAWKLSSAFACYAIERKKLKLHEPTNWHNMFTKSALLLCGHAGSV